MDFLRVVGSDLNIDPAKVKSVAVTLAKYFPVRPSLLCPGLQPMDLNPFTSLSALGPSLPRPFVQVLTCLFRVQRKNISPYKQR
jgi:hypothetical protein